MKTVKLNPEEQKINRELIAKIGETIYQSPGIDSVLIKVSFKDGTTVEFKRKELEDEINGFLGGE